MSQDLFNNPLLDYKNPPTNVGATSSNVNRRVVTILHQAMNDRSIRPEGMSLLTGYSVDIIKLILSFTYAPRPAHILLIAATMGLSWKDIFSDIPPRQQVLHFINLAAQDKAGNPSQIGQMLQMLETNENMIYLTMWMGYLSAANTQDASYIHYKARYGFSDSISE